MFLRAGVWLHGIADDQGRPYALLAARTFEHLARGGERSKQVLQTAFAAPVVAHHPDGQDAAAHLVLPVSSSAVLAWSRLLAPLPDELGGERIWLVRLSRALLPIRNLAFAQVLAQAEDGPVPDIATSMRAIAEASPQAPLANPFLALG